MRKPRGDSNLKTLPEDQQEEIIARLAAKGGTLQSVKAWLAADHRVTCSVASLSEFYSWYRLKERMDQTESTVEQVMAKLAEGNAGLSPQQLREYGDLLFMAEATKTGDPKTYIAMAQVLQTDRKLNQDERKLANDDRRIALLEKKAAQADAAKDLLQDETLTMEQRNAKMRETFGMA